MVSSKVVEDQLKRIDFKLHSWGKAEARELPNVLLPEEEIYEAVNGMYEGGFALLVATNFRLLLIDKKPLNYLTVEDLRFDMINEIDYSHRLTGARISISTGSKNLKFTSYNQPRLRKLISHVQHCMAESKKKQSDHQEGQNVHLEQINQQLQAYLIAQHQQQEQLRQQLQSTQSVTAPQLPVDAIKPTPELADYLFAQRLLAEYREGQKQLVSQQQITPQVPTQATTALPQAQPQQQTDPEDLDLYTAGREEIFHRQLQTSAAAPVSEPNSPEASQQPAIFRGLEINPMRIAYSKLPMALRNRKFGRPSFHAHSKQVITPIQVQPAPN